jgi:hypothetical protein
VVLKSKERYLKVRIVGLLVATSSLSFGGIGSAAGNDGVDVNDVSILFPEPRNEQELGRMLRADTDLGNGQTILPAQILGDVLETIVLGKNERAPNAALLDESGRVTQQLDLPGSGLGSSVVAGPAVQLADRSRWVVVSLRFDYGFPGDFVPESERSAQLRLILQPVPDLSNRNGFAADAAIHLLFDFAKGDSPVAYDQAKLALANSILRIKKESMRSGLTTTGKALAVHPVLNAEGLLGPFNTVLKREIVKLLSEAELSSIAVMVAGNGVIPWFFFSGLVKDGRYQPLAQRFNKVNSLFESFLEAVPLASPLGTASPEFTDGRPQTNDFLINNRGGSSVGEMLPIDAKGARSLGLIQDPHFGGQQPNRPDALNHLSCTTCHAATARQIGIPKESIVVPEIRGITPTNSPTNFIAQGSEQDQLWNVRNFGYFVRRPSIALRTLNESVLVAAETNRILNLSVVGSQCKNVAAYLSCLGSQARRPSSEQTCFVTSCN